MRTGLGEFRRRRNVKAEESSSLPRRGWLRRLVAMIGAGALLGSLLTALPAVDDSPAYASEPTTMEGAVSHFRYDPAQQRWKFGYWARLENHNTYCIGFYNCHLALQFLSASGTVVFSYSMKSNASDGTFEAFDTYWPNTAGGTPAPVVAARLRLSFTSSVPPLYSATVALPGGVLPEETVGGDDQCQCGAVDPVNTATGEFYLNAEDLALAGVGPNVALARSYSSTRAASSGTFGYGWVSALDAQVVEVTPPAVPGDPPLAVKVIKETGAAVSYTLSAGGDYVAGPHVRDVLERDAVTGAWAFTRPEGSRLTFTSAGLLVEIADRFGNSVTVSRDSYGVAQSINGSGGRSIDLTWSSGRVTEAEDSAGRSVTYSYSTAGDLVGVVGVRGETTAYTYNASHLLTKVTTPEGGVTTNTYSSGKVTKQVDPVGRATSFVYQSSGSTLVFQPNGYSYYDYYTNGVLTARKDANNKRTIFVYNEANQLLSTRNPLGQVATSTYDSNGYVATSTDALGRTVAFVNDPWGNPLSITDPAGGVATFSYDSEGLLLSSTSPEGVQRSWTYNADGTVATSTDGVGATTTYTYDSRGLPLCVTDPETRATCVTYGSEGFVETSVDGLGNVTQFDRDPAGLVTLLTDPEGRETSFAYDGEGRLVTTTTPDGGVRSLTYDAAGQVLTSTDEGNNTTSYTYSGLGQVQTVTDPLGGVTTAAYTPIGLLSTVTDPLSRVSRLTYDAAGRVLTSVLPSGATTTYSYDAAGQLLTVTDANGDTSAYTYDANGLSATVEDPLSRVTAYGYDLDGVLTEVTLPDSSSINLAYDDEGRLTQYTSADGAATAYTYDDAGLLVGKLEPGARATSYAYDAAGRLDALTRPDGSVESRDYDDSGLLLSIDYPGTSSDVTFAYTPDGLRSSMTDLTGTTTYDYTVTDLLESVETGSGALIGYAYDAAGRQVSITYPGSRTVDYSYDAAGQMQSVTDWNDVELDLTWSVDSRLATQDFASGVVESRSYDAAGHLLQMALASTSAISQFDYTYDDAGQVTIATTSRGGTAQPAREYTYDPLGQLDGLEIDSVTLPYGATSDRLLTEMADGSTLGYDAAGQLTSLTPATGPATSYLYDANGSRTSAEVAANAPDLAQTTTYTYDAALALASVTLPDSSVVSYESNGDGLRQSRTDAAGTTDYLWNVNASLPMLIEDDNYSYLYAVDLTPYARIDKTTGATEYLHGDLIGSVRTITDDAGAEIGTADFDDFGTPLATTGTTSIFGFSGNLTDPDTGLIYLRARDYDPQAGQFLTVDPAIDTTRQAYTYAENAPVLFTDPSGLDALSDIGSGVGAFLLGVLDDQTMGLSSVLLGAIVPGYDCFVSTNPWFEVGSAFSMVVTTVVLVATGVGAIVAAARIAVKIGVRALVRQGAQAVANTLRVGTRSLGGVSNAASSAARACSFTGETVVLMANGDQRPIEEVEAGDLVIASDPETGEQVAKEVEQVFVHEDSVFDLVIDGEVISTTEDHPFWSVTDQQFERADELEPGELVLAATGATVQVSGALAGSTRTTSAYNLSVEDLHTFHVGAGAILVHNRDTCEVFVNLASQSRTSHILDGEIRPNGTFGGGHRGGTGYPDKTEFPSDWSDAQVMHHISDVATDPSIKWVPDNGAFWAHGTRVGVDISVLIRRGQIVTAFPTNLPRNP